MKKRVHRQFDLGSYGIPARSERSADFMVEAEAILSRLDGKVDMLLRARFLNGDDLVEASRRAGLSIEVASLIIRAMFGIT